MVAKGIIDFYFHFFLGQQDDRSPTFQLNSSCPLSVWYQGSVFSFSFCQGQAGFRIYILHAIVILVLPFLFFLFSSSFFVLLRAVIASFLSRSGFVEAGEKSFVVLGEKREEKEKYNIFRSSRRSSSRLSSWSLNFEPLGMLSQIVGDVMDGFRSASRSAKLGSSLYQRSRL